MIRLWILAALVCAAICPPAQPQTQIDLGAQGRNVDFSAAARTKPFKTGTTLPATCSAGETFFKTDAPVGQNLYVCSSTNTWAGANAIVASNSGPGGVEVLKSQAGTTIVGRQALAGEGIVLGQQTDTITVEVDTAVVPRYSVSAGAPTGACQDGRDLFTRTAGFPNFYTCISGVWKASWAVTSSLPGACYVGELLYHTVEQAIYGCTATNIWTRLTQNGGVDLTASGDCFVASGCAPTPLNQRSTLFADATAGKFAAIRIVLRDTIKLGKGLIYGGAGGASAGFTMAIYADNNGAPGAKISNTDLRFINLVAAGPHQITWGNGAVVLTPKVYWLGFSAEDPATTFSQPGGFYGSYAFLQGSLGAKPGFVKCSNPVTGTGADYELPASCGTATALASFGMDVPIVISSAE